MSTLDEKKAEIDNLVAEFSWHSSRVAEIEREVIRLIESLQKEHGAAALPIIVDSTLGFNEWLQELSAGQVPRGREILWRLQKAFGRVGVPG